MPYQWLRQADSAEDLPDGGAPTHRMLAGVLAKVDGHFHLDTLKDGKNVRINSRDVPAANDNHTAVSIKPSRTVDGTGGVTGLEVSPRCQAGIGANDLRAILGDPVLKAGSGDIDAQVVAFEANLDFGVSGDRTITGDVSAFSAFLAVPSTYTYSAKVSFLRVRDVNIRGWDCFLNLDSAGTGMTTTDDKTGGTDYGTLKVYIGDTLYHIALYADS